MDGMELCDHLQKENQAVLKVPLQKGTFLLAQNSMFHRPPSSELPPLPRNPSSTLPP